MKNLHYVRSYFSLALFFMDSLISLIWCYTGQLIFAGLSFEFSIRPSSIELLWI